MSRVTGRPGCSPRSSTQCVGVAVRKDQNKFEEPPFERFDTNGIEVFGGFLADADDDGIDENYAFERKPLYVQINPKDAKSFRVLGLHLKTGHLRGLQWSKWWQIADANRRKILAQASQIRLRFLDPYMADPATREIPLIVCGDINDGPGLDASEKKLFDGSASGGADGNGLEARAMPAQRSLRLPEGQRAGRTRLRSDRDHQLPGSDLQLHLAQEWIDHVLYTESPDETWVVNAEVHERMPDGTPIWKKYEYASDHFPVSAAVTT